MNLLTIILEKEKKNNWRNNPKRVGNIENNTPFQYGLGASRLNLGLGGASGSGVAGTGNGKELSQSQNFLNLPKTDGIASTFRSNLGGIDKSMDNFKSAFSTKFSTNGLKLGTYATA